MSLINESVRKQQRKYFGGRDDLHFIIGVSGGMDSMTLLYSFKQLNISAHVVHVNYRKRGKASKRDARLVAECAEEWGFGCRIESVDPKEAEGENFQQWARNRRYELFKEEAHNQQATGIAVAHHQDDQVETIMQKIFRGAGLASWSAMSVWDGQLFRPLLDISRKEIATCAEQNSIPYRTDASNLQSGFARNFLRNEWLSKLSDFFPGWKGNVLNIPKQARCFEESLEWIADRITEQQGISREAYQRLTPALQKSLLLHLLKQRAPNIEISQQALNQIDDLPQLQTGKSIQLSKDYYLLRDRDFYCIVKEQKREGATQTFDRHQLEQSHRSTMGVELKIEAFERVEPDKNIQIDSDKVSWPITIRPWQAADKFQPLGMEGHQLVSDHLTNRKISAAIKSQALVIESFEETICAVIFPPIKNRAPAGTISEQVKCDSDTNQSLKIRYSS